MRSGKHRLFYESDDMKSRSMGQHSIFASIWRISTLDKFIKSTGMVVEVR